MDESNEPIETYDRDTVRNGDYRTAAVEAELDADAAEAVLDDETLERVADEVEDQLGLPVRLAHESDINPSFEMSVYRRNDDYPGLLLVTSVDVSDVEDEQAALEELQRRRDTLSRVCEETDFTPSVLTSEELVELIEAHRDENTST
jgi:hypothetical protein